MPDSVARHCYDNAPLFTKMRREWLRYEEGRRGSELRYEA